MKLVVLLLLLSYISVASSSPNGPEFSPFSCNNDTSMDHNLCNFEHPGGIVIMSQFWEYENCHGPEDSFTVHGLLPSYCIGKEVGPWYCGGSPEPFTLELISDHYFDSILKRHMLKYWPGTRTKGKFTRWAKQYRKHGSCFSTLKKECYTQQEGQNWKHVVDYYRVTMELFRSLPTYDWLLSSGIYPRKGAYSLKMIEDELTILHGAKPQVLCKGGRDISEVRYFYNVQWKLAGGKFKPIDLPEASTCNDFVRFRVKSGTRFYGTVPPPQATPQAQATRGYTTVGSSSLESSGQLHCGDCAAFNVIEKLGGAHLLTTQGYCGVEDGVLTCTPQMDPTLFRLNNSDSALGDEKHHVSKEPIDQQKRVSVPADSGVPVPSRLVPL